MTTASHETDLIDLIIRNENRQKTRRNLIIGIGDDAAVIRVSNNHDLVTCTDTLVSGVHFPTQICAYDIGWKSLAVNLSDLAAMAAKPKFAQLALTLPSADTEWLQDFISGWSELANQHGVSLIGGDITRGPLSITVQAMGEVLRGESLQRGGAQVGDLLVVSGALGGASMALQQFQSGKAVSDDLLERLNRPQPRVDLGLALRGVASSAIDLSDGMGIDLKRLLQGSGFGAKVQLTQLPLNSALAKLNEQEKYSLALSGGDDYELLFSLPAQLQAKLAEISSLANVPLAVIGEVCATPSVEFRTANDAIFTSSFNAYEHFDD